MRSTVIAVVTVSLSVIFTGMVAAREGRKSEPASEAAAVEDGISVYFCPNGGALQAVAAEINGAKKSIDVQAYMLTTTKLAKPLQDAHRRGVKVRVLIDDRNA